MKGQSTIVGFILVTAIAVVIVSLSLFWALPLLEKTRDQQEVQRLGIKFLELHEAIKKVASNQGSLSVDFDIPRGLLSLDADSNSIIYSGQFNIANPTPRKAIFGGVNGTINFTQVRALNITQPGVLGVDEPAVLIEEGAVQFLLHYRPLNNTAGDCFRIRLLAGNTPGAGVGPHTIILTWKSEFVNSSATTFSGVSCSSVTDQRVEFDVK